ncbi:MAG: ThuA domain-containing protein [Verrucomicrobiota bacterium]
MKRILCVLVAGAFVLGAHAEEKLKLLLVDGQNNHSWATTSPLMVKILEESGRFDVTVATSPAAPPRGPRKPKNPTDEQKKQFADDLRKWQAEVDKVKAESKDKWAEWRPKFSDYDVVVSNYNGEMWPDEVQKAFEAYVNGGGGFVSVHAADNAFPQWKAYNEMIAVGGWGGRSEMSGPYLRLRDGAWTKDMTPGRGGAHGSQHEFTVTKRANHPIVDGLPDEWLHAKDELYDRLRGPAKNVTVIASAYAPEEQRGSGEHEPMLMVIDYGKGRCFHTTLGHSTDAMSGLGFQETLKRGAEWVATGNVTFGEISAEMLTSDKVALGVQ